MMKMRELGEALGIALAVIVAGATWLVMMAIILSIPLGIAWVLYAFGVFLLGVS